MSQYPRFLPTLRAWQRERRLITDRLRKQQQQPGSEAAAEKHEQTWPVLQRVRPSCPSMPAAKPRPGVFRAASLCFL